MQAEAAPRSSDLFERMARFPLLDALLDRRSRRFARGMSLNGGPLAYASAAQPAPLSAEEEAALAFAACGITGYALAELPFASGDMAVAGGGNIMTHFVGRTVASADAIHNAICFVLNDEGTWLLKRPQDYPRADVGELIGLARSRRFLELYQRSRVQIADHRLDVIRDVPFVPPFNKWSANVPHTTYFLPVHELTGLYINILLSAFDHEFASFILDDRKNFRPAGLARFAHSRGGHLNDDPRSGRVITVGFIESWINECCSIEQGAMHQNLALMTEALGLGGFPHFAAYPAIWMKALGFRMVDVPFSRAFGAGRGLTATLRLLRRDIPMPTAIGLEIDGEVLIKPFCPPYYPSMRDAVLAVVERKYAPGGGTFRDGGAATAWLDGAKVQAGIPAYSDEAIEATIAYCEYIYGLYGRFPSSSGPFRTVVAYQAHRLDPDFYGRFYKEDALSPAQRQS